MGHVPETITITDNRTGQQVEVPIVNGAVDAKAWSKLLPGVWFLDPSFGSTAATESSITELDGEAGILRYRGYPIEQLAEKSSYLEVAYLLIHGELPTSEQFEQWRYDIIHHTFIHENVRKRFMEGFHYDAHPMGILVSSAAALSTFYPEAKDIEDPANLDRQIVRLIAKMPTLAAGAYRFSVGMPFVYPDNSLDFCANFLSMMWKIAEPRYDANPVLARALDVLFILHADHEQNCSTNAMRAVAPKLATMREERDRVALGFIPDYYMTEYHPPGSAAALDLIANLEANRGRGAWELMCRAMLLAGCKTLNDLEKADLIVGAGLERWAPASVRSGASLSRRR